MPGAPEPAPLDQGPIRYLPVIPGRLESAIEVRRAILTERPGVVAVELPANLEPQYVRSISRLPEVTVAVLEPTASSAEAIYIPIEPCDPMVEAVRSAWEIEAEVLFLEPDADPRRAAAFPDPHSIRSVGYARYVDLWRRSHRRELSGSRYRQMARTLQGSNPGVRTIAVITLPSVDGLLAAMGEPQEDHEAAPAHREVELIHPHPDCLVEILNEYPYLQHVWEEARMLGEYEIDRSRIQLEVMRHAETTYRENTGEDLVHWQRKLLARYTRNLASMSGDLIATAFDLAVAGRSVVDDNFGWEVWESANRYPAQKATSDLETVRISGEEMWLRAKRIKLRRRLPNFKKRVRPSLLKGRKKEGRPGEWAAQLQGGGICSYPPEDLVVENYGRFLKRKAQSVLSEERERVEPFVTSLLDGIDIRETIRNWHERKIYVRRQERIHGEVGAVVVIFDEDRDDRYGYLTTWLGEHQNESDMAFYSTFPFEHVVGPGIGRAEYGGFLMTLPPRRMYDVWSDPDYSFAETKAERLLLAALDYSVEKIVVYVAKKPPRSVFRTIAGRLGQRILYIPIGQLSPSKLKHVRVVHVLDSHERRDQAKGYLW